MSQRLGKISVIGNVGNKVMYINNQIIPMKHEEVTRVKF